MNQYELARQRGFANFRARVEALGGSVPDQDWHGTAVKHSIICPEGHRTDVRPSYLSKGGGLCRVCAGNDPAAAWEGFRSRVAALGGTVLEPEWLGARVKHRVRCAEGHECNPVPFQLKAGSGFCKRCARNSTERAQEEFFANVVRLGGTVTEPEWLGSQAKHRVTCRNGHRAEVMPNSVAQGQGMCRHCNGKGWDVFYVVANDDTVKFGVTTNTPRRRLTAHKRAGLPDVLRVWEGLSGGQARALERELMDLLQERGEQPQRGLEYFGRHCADFVVMVADERLS